jgi:hypothetical protein
MIYAAGNGTTVSPERKPAQQQPRRFVKGMVIKLPGDGTFTIHADVTGMVGNVGKSPTFVQVSMTRPGDDTVIIRPMSAHRFVQVVSMPSKDGAS